MKLASSRVMFIYKCWQISPIQSLVGRIGRSWVMGVISQLEDGHFYLEDLTAAVEINLSNAISFTTSSFTLFRKPFDVEQLEHVSDINCFFNMFSTK